MREIFLFLIFFNCLPCLLFFLLFIYFIYTFDFVSYLIHLAFMGSSLIRNIFILHQFQIKDCSLYLKPFSFLVWFFFSSKHETFHLVGGFLHHSGKDRFYIRHSRHVRSGEIPQEAEDKS